MALGTADPSCQNNVGVTCPTENRQCDKCGWNLAVSIKRKISILEQRQGARLEKK